MSGARARDPRLILVEGLTGSGKSTTAQWLSHALAATGRRARWFHEQEHGHPIYRQSELDAARQAGAHACLDYHEQSLARWRQLVADVMRGDTVTVIESSFLQAPIVSMQLTGCPDRAIDEHAAAVAAIVAPLDPVLVLLRQDDVHAALARVYAARGPDFERYLATLVQSSAFVTRRMADGPVAVSDVLDAYAEALHRTVAALSMPVVDVDVSGAEWSICRARIAAALGLAVVDLYAPVAGPSRFTGRYRDVDSGQELVVDADDGGLFLRPTGHRLLLRHGTTFDIEAVSAEVTFDPTGETAERLMCIARFPPMGPVWVRQS